MRLGIEILGFIGVSGLGAAMSRLEV